MTPTRTSGTTPTPIQVAAQIRKDACAKAAQMWRGEPVTVVQTVWRQGKLVQRVLTGTELIQAMHEAASEIEWRYVHAQVNMEIRSTERELVTA